MSQQSYRYIETVYHPNNFYEIIFKVATRDALDEWLDVLEGIYQLPRETKVKLLTDTRKTTSPPLAYAFRKGQELVKHYPNRPKPIRSVFLATENQGVMDKIVQSFIQLLRTGDEILYLYGEKREQALNFLFVNEPEIRP